MKIILLMAGLTLLVLICASKIKASEPLADSHQCGSHGFFEYPNKPKVRLFPINSAEQAPAQILMFFIDDKGRGYFENLGNVDKKTIEKVWGIPSKIGNTFSIWGKYAAEKVESSQKKYSIEVEFKDDKVKAYRVSGPQVTSPSWVSM